MALAQEGPSVKPGTHVYQGIPFPSLIPKGCLEAMKTFKMRDGDVVVLSYPKSGTNWIYQIVHEILGWKIENASFRALETCWPGQLPLHVQLRESPSPRLMITHLPFPLAPPEMVAPKAKVKVLVVLRNPKDVCVSLYYFKQKFLYAATPESWEQHSTSWLEGKEPFGDYFHHVMGWWQKRDDPHFLFVKYEDMKKDLSSSVKGIATFLESELTNGDLDRVLSNCNIESMRKSVAGSDREVMIRKGIVGDWKNHFSAEENEKFDQKYRERMAGSGLEFDFE